MAYTHLFLLPLLAASLSQEHMGSDAPDPSPAASQAENWQLVMTVGDDSELWYGSPYWTNNALLSEDGHGNAKYQAFINASFKRLRMCIGSECVMHTFDNSWTSAKELFQAGYIRDPSVDQAGIISTFAVPVGTYADCPMQRPGFNIECKDGNSARWGYCGNCANQACQNDDGHDADFAIGIGLHGQSTGHLGAGWTNYMASGAGTCTPTSATNKRVSLYVDSEAQSGVNAPTAPPTPAPMYKTNDDHVYYYNQCMNAEYEPITTEAECRQMATDFIGGTFKSSGSHGHWPPGCFRYNGVNGKDVYLSTNSGGTGKGGHVMVCKRTEPTPAPTPAPPTPAPTTAAQYFGSTECTVGEVCVSGSWATYYQDSTSEKCMERCAAGYHGMQGLGVGNCTHFTFGPDGTCVLYTQCERGSGSVTIGFGGASKVITDTAQFTTCNSPYSPPVTADWVLISSQDRRKAGFSGNARNTYLENENNPDAYTYMIVGKLTKDDWKTSNGKYHFKLVYYNDNENDGDELEWTQTNWLTDSHVTESEAISPDNLMVSKGCETFKGLAKCSGGQAVFDGDGYGSGCWWNCVGCVHSHGGGMPAWNSQIRKLYKLYIWGNPRSLA